MASPSDAPLVDAPAEAIGATTSGNLEEMSMEALAALEAKLMRLTLARRVAALQAQLSQPVETVVAVAPVVPANDPLPDPTAVRTARDGIEEFARGPRQSTDIGAATLGPIFEAYGLPPVAPAEFNPRVKECLALLYRAGAQRGGDYADIPLLSEAARASTIGFLRDQGYMRGTNKYLTFTPEGRLVPHSAAHADRNALRRVDRIEQRMGSAGTSSQGSSQNPARGPSLNPARGPSQNPIWGSNRFSDAPKVTPKTMCQDGMPNRSSSRKRSSSRRGRRGRSSSRNRDSQS